MRRSSTKHLEGNTSDGGSADERQVIKRGVSWCFQTGRLKEVKVSRCNLI